MKPQRLDAPARDYGLQGGPQARHSRSDGVARGIVIRPGSPVPGPPRIPPMPPKPPITPETKGTAGFTEATSNVTLESGAISIIALKRSGEPADIGIPKPGLPRMGNSR